MFILKENKEVNSIDEEREIAKKLHEAVRKKEQEDAEKISWEEQAMKEDELTPVEEFSTTMACYLANITARRFQKITKDCDSPALRQLIIRIEHSDSKTAVSMIQAIFLSTGQKHAAEDLDILELCEKFVSDVYDDFFDYLFDTDVFGSYFVTCLVGDGFVDGRSEMKIERRWADVTDNLNM